MSALRLSKKPSLRHSPLYVTLPTVRVVIFLLFPFLDFLIALKALEGFLDNSELNVRLDWTWRDLTRILESFLLSLHNLLIRTEEELDDLQIFKFS